jgi:hypothetical protein
MYYSKEPVCTVEPVDILEPLDDANDYREAGIAYLRIISLAMSHILEADNAQVAALGVAYALGLISVVGNETMREAGRRLNLSSGTISYHAKLFGKKAGLPPSALMKSEEQAEQSREARNRYVAQSEATQIDLK